MLFSWYSRAFYGQISCFFCKMDTFSWYSRAFWGQFVLFSCFIRAILVVFCTVFVLFSWWVFRDSRGFFFVILVFFRDSRGVAREWHEIARTAREIARWELRNIAREKEKKMSCNVAQFQKKQGKIS